MSAVLFRKCEKSAEERKTLSGWWRKGSDCRFSACKRSINFRRIQQSKAQTFPSVDHVGNHYFHSGYCNYDFLAGSVNIYPAATAMAYRRTDAGRWWILVLVFHPR